MGDLLLVALTAGEEAALGGLTSSSRIVGLDLLDSELARPDLEARLDAVVVGAGTSSPLAVVQRVHRASPTSGAVVITTPGSDVGVRRAATYAPDLPASLAIVTADAHDLPDRVRDVLESSRAQRQHRRTIEAVTARETVSPAQARLPASLGALLDHAPFGVLVGSLDGELITWNRWAGDLLDLPHDATGRQVGAMFPAPDPLDKAFALARQGLLTGATAPFALVGPSETDVEVTTAPTLLDDGQEAVLVLFQDVTARRHAERTRDRLAAHVGLLGHVSESLAGTLDEETALLRLADRMVPGLADWVSIQTYDERRRARRVVVRHRDPARERRALAIREGLMGGLGESSPSRRVLAVGQPVLITQVSHDDLAAFVPDPSTREVVARLGVGSVVSVPLPGRDEVLGSMSLVRGPDSAPYTEEELAVAVEVGRRAGVALDTLSLYARQRDRAAELQRSLLTEPPQTDQAEVVVRYVAAAEEAQVGGDWYDAFLQADGSTVLVIGDVMGHDTRAAAAMGQLRALLRGISYTTGAGPAEMLSRLDEAIEGLRVQTTATGLVVRVEPRATGSTGPAELCWSNAGHPPPIVVLPGGGAVVLHSEDPDLLLGVLAHTDRSERHCSLEPGGTLLLYTDGLIERRHKSIDQSIALLTETVDRLSALPLEEMCDALLAELLPEDNDDDVALVAVRLLV